MYNFPVYVIFWRHIPTPGASALDEPNVDRYVDTARRACYLKLSSNRKTISSLEI